MSSEPDQDQDDAAEASDAGADLEGKRGTVKASQIRLLDDGSLSYRRGESFVLLLADGVDRGEAWRAVGGVQNGSSGQTLRLLVNNPVFKVRLEVLETEKSKLEAMGVHGEAMWAAKQSFRAARVAQDVTATQRAAELMARIADKLEPSENANPAGSTGEGVRPVGRPPSEARSTKVDPARIKSALLALGKKAPAPIAVDEPAPEGAAA